MILICGIPNAGKTTYSKKYDNVIHFDEVLGGRRRWDKVIEMVKADNTIVIDGVYDKAEDRKRLVNVSNSKNTCIWLDVPVETCLNREKQYRQRCPHVVIWASESFEPPTLNEGWDEIIIIRGDEKYVYTNEL